MMKTTYSSKDGWESFISYRDVACCRMWGRVKPTKKQIRKFMKRLRVKIQRN